MEYPPELVHGFFGMGMYPSFMLTNFSSSSMLACFVTYTLYDLVVFQVFQEQLQSQNLLIASLAFRVLRFVLVVFMGVLWYFKYEQKVCAPKRGMAFAVSPYLPSIQALTVMLQTFALSAPVLFDVLFLNPDRVGLPAHVLLSLTGLKLCVPMAFFVVRDTPPDAFMIAWMVGIFTTFACCVQARDKEQTIDLALYILTTLIIFRDSFQRNKMMRDTVTKLENTLRENEKLAVEAQAIELRAMIGNVAHDLKTPLTSFLSGIECISDILLEWREFFSREDVMSGAFFGSREHMLRASGNNELMLSCIANMNSTNSFMTMTINRCLDYTKSTNGFKLVPKFETVCLKSVLQMPVSLIRDAHSSIDIQTMTVSDEISSHIITDKQWLLENLLCLLSNAAKYSHRGCVDVGVTLRSAEDQPKLHFEIQDTGIGLSDEAMQGLFNPFKQAQRLAGGTGLGLFSLAKRMEALHGEFGVMRRSDGEQGSVFWFTVPYRPDEMSAGVSHHQQCTTSAPLAPATLDLRIGSNDSSDCSAVITSLSALATQYEVLVVDDAPLIVKMTTMLLQRKGHRVQHAVNGVEALEKLMVRASSTSSDTGASVDEEIDKGRVLQVSPQVNDPSALYNVVLMDLQMPVMDGIEAIRRLRAAEKKRGAERKSHSSRQFIIALSANSDEETRQEALGVGADAFMSKPFTYDAFVAIMSSKQ